MAQYKVPQDVEADDKLLGPFSFRQFIYLMVVGTLIALSVGLFQLFPLLAILPLPPALFFLILALPLKKDQPMETYLAAILSYYTRPHVRKWEAGQRTTTIEIMAPKKVEQDRTRNITGEEATHRLSFLADIVDTEGYAIKGFNTNPMREDLMAEASTATDMFEGARFDNLATTIQQEENERHAEVVKHMQETIQETQRAAAFGTPVASAAPVAPTAPMAPAGYAVGTTGNLAGMPASPAPLTSPAGYVANGATVATPTPAPAASTTPAPTSTAPAPASTAAAAPASTAPASTSTASIASTNAATPAPTVRRHSEERKHSAVVVEPVPEDPEAAKKQRVEKSLANMATGPGVHRAEQKVDEKPVKTTKTSIAALADNDAFSVATIAEQAKRIKDREEGEIFISLH